MCASALGHGGVVRLLCDAGTDKDKAKQDGAMAYIWSSAKLVLRDLFCCQQEPEAE